MTAKPDLLPSSVAAFTEALHGDRGSLDAWLEVHDEREVRAHVEAYARANIGVATAAKDAEIEALRAEVAAWRELSDHVRVGACAAIWPDRYTDARTRDVAAALKRAAWMAEALREVMLWIENWSPPFTEDDEWPDTEAKAQAALHPAAAQESNDA